MVSKNLEQGIQAIQQKDLKQGGRLLRIALKNKNLTRQERVNAYLWLAETGTDPEFKIEQYQAAIQLDPTNQDILGRLNFWLQTAQQNNTPSRGMPPANPAQDLNIRPDFGMNSPTGGMPPQANPQQQNWGQGNFNSPVNPPQDLNIRPDFGMNSPTGGMPPQANPQQQNWGQRGTQPFQQHNDLNIQPGWGHNSTQGTGAISPDTQGWKQTQPNFNQGFQEQSTQIQPPLPDQFSTQQMRAFGQQPIHLEQVQRTVGIQGGPNGAGTGFFVARDGLIATSRHIIGGESQVGVQLLDGRQIVGHVVRSFPSINLALLKVHVQLTHLIGVSQSPIIPDNMPIVAVTHAGEGIRSAKRSSDNETKQHWFPTLINHLKDAGGNPVFDNNNMLVGMLTNNANRSNGYMFGLHIHKIYECVNLYIQEQGQLAGQNTIYCNSCGIISRAPAFGGYFCERCGNTHPYAVDIKRYPQPNLGALYGEDQRQPCPNCSSQAGFYNRACLCCGYRL